MPDQQEERHDPETGYSTRGKPLDWPHWEIRGGPHGKKTEVKVDGVPIRKTTRVEVTFDVNDAVRIVTTQLGEVYVDAVVDPANVLSRAKVDVYLGGAFNDGSPFAPHVLLATATADSIWEALYDCGRQLELQAKRDAGVAQAGTIEESSGRPPGHVDKG